MPERIDLAGARTGMLTVLHDCGVPSKNGGRRWVCRCDCGNEVTVASKALRKHLQKSCGCLVRTHNMSRTTTYKSWQMMWQRCTNKANENYQSYGAKGVSVCDRWKAFEFFVADMGERPDGTSLDRIDPFGNYEPDNCRWATSAVQKANTRSSLGYRTLDGERISLSQMAHCVAMNPATFYDLIRRRPKMRLAR
jgi:hypothetical protein